MNSAAWLTAPVMLTGSRAFTCESSGFDPEQCDYYKYPWHFWYIADYVFALPTVAFFLSVIGVFVLGNLLSSHILGYRRFRGPRIWQKLIAATRYLSYRGFYVKSLGWSSAPIGILLLGAVGTIFFFCMDLAPQPYYWPSLDWGGSPPLATRSGWMSLACMPFVFATASKTNWITLLTGVSHEKIQVFHRWTAYAFLILALLHTFPFIVYHVRFHDMIMHFKMNLLFYWTGIVAIIFQAWLTFMSHSTIRNFGYEFFKFAHFSAAAIFMLMLFWHCDYTLTSWHYFIATACVYVPCFIFPWLRTCFEYGIKEKAQIFVEDNGFIRIVIPVNFSWTPGQHCFLRFTSFGLMSAISSHPFTVCSTPPNRADEPSELVFYIRHQRGLTAKLYDLGMKNPGIQIPVMIDGPYGGINMQRYDESDHLLVVAGGSGAGWCLPFIERFVRHGLSASERNQNPENKIDTKELGADNELAHEQRTSGPFSIRIILATRDVKSRAWFLQAVDDLLSKSPSFCGASSIQVQVYLTGETASPEKIILDGSQLLKTDVGIVAESNASGKDSVNSGREVAGRPKLPLIISEDAITAAEARQSLGVFVCGPTTMQNDVRNAVADVNLKIMKGFKSSGAYLHCEHFSWA